mmetsp:Transcript_3690/g.4753  ORF Transcript_3690/g.4753 Transcript_3690/m.4753 type:complete len:263 (-) Transcript_3690:29-817(-)
MIEKYGGWETAQEVDETTKDDDAPSVLVEDTALSSRRQEWITLVQSCQTLGHFATILTHFAFVARPHLEKLITLHENFASCLKEWMLLDAKGGGGHRGGGRRGSGGRGSGGRGSTGRGKKRRNSRLSDEGRIVSSSADKPLWTRHSLEELLWVWNDDGNCYYPAQRCCPLDDKVKDTIRNLSDQRMLISYVGRESEGMRAVYVDDVMLYDDDVKKKEPKGKKKAFITEWKRGVNLARFLWKNGGGVVEMEDDCMDEKKVMEL